MKMLLNRWGLLALAILLAAIWFIWHDIAEQTSDVVGDLFSVDIDSPPLAHEDLPQVKKVWLERPWSNAYQLRVDGLRASGAAGGKATLGFRLRSLVPGNGYPILTVYFYSEDGKPPSRKQVFAPDQYPHGTQLTDEEVKLDVDLQKDEISFDVVPGYGGGEDSL